MKRVALFGLTSAFIILSAAAAARAQGEQSAPKVEVGVQFTSLSLNQPNSPGSESLPGVGARVTYNFTDYFAVEAEGNVSYVKGQRSFVTGGHMEQLQAGVKVGKRWERFGLFAKARPGFVSFEEAGRPEPTTFTNAGGATVTTLFFGSERKTHFSTDVGGVLEFYPSRRVVVRFDAGDTIIRHGEHDEFGPFIVLPGGDIQQFTMRVGTEVEHNFQFSAGVAFRFGGGDETEPAADTTSGGLGLKRFEVGAQFTSLLLNLPESAFVSPFFIFDPGHRAEEGGGPRVGFNLNNSVALEAEANFFVRESFFPNNSTGGFPMQFQAGVKAGKRWSRFGLFGKARPGFISFSRVQRLAGIDTVVFSGGSFEVPRFELARRNYFSMDVGGVLEYYPKKRFFTRFDFGDTIIRYGQRQDFAFNLGEVFRTIQPETQHNFQFSAGLGFRF